MKAEHYFVMGMMCFGNSMAAGCGAATLSWGQQLTTGLLMVVVAAVVACFSSGRD